MLSAAFSCVKAYASKKLKSYKNVHLKTWFF